MSGAAFAAILNFDRIMDYWKEFLINKNIIIICTNSKWLTLDGRAWVASFLVVWFTELKFKIQLRNNRGKRKGYDHFGGCNGNWKSMKKLLEGFFLFALSNVVWNILFFVRRGKRKRIFGISSRWHLLSKTEHLFSWKKKEEIYSTVLNRLHFSSIGKC